MKGWIGAAMFLVGGGVSVAGFIANSRTPLQVGPVPVIGGGAVALVGLIMFVSAV